VIDLDAWQVFSKGLGVMTKLYASITGTCVLQIKTVPPRPPQYDGCVVVYGVAEETMAEAQAEAPAAAPAPMETPAVAALRTTLEAFGELRSLELLPAARQARVRYRLHTSAENVVAESGLAADHE
jgi:hypothetical protein